MTHTLAAWWPLLRKRLPADLVGPEAGIALARLAGYLPGSSLFAIECRLAAASRQVDLSCRLDRDMTVSAPDLALRSAPLRELLDSWQFGALAGTGRLWIELDLPVGDALNLREGDLPVPIVCIEMKPGSANLIAVLEVLARRVLSPAQIRSVSEWSRRFPCGARVLYAFGLWSRPGAPVRLEWVGVPMAEAVDVLRTLVPSQVMDGVRRAAGLLAGVERPHLSFDALFDSDGSPEILPRVGLEGSFTAPPERDARWRSLLDRWVAAGLCDPAKAAASLDFSGVDSYGSCRRDWPTEEVGLGGHAVRRLSHLKLVARPDGELEGKVYLLFQYLRPRSLHGRTGR